MVDFTGIDTEFNKVEKRFDIFGEYLQKLFLHIFLKFGIICQNSIVFDLSLLTDRSLQRFDDLIEIPKPGQLEIVQLLKATLASMPFKGIDWKTLSEQMIGFSAALVVKIANDAAKTAVINNRQILTQTDLEQALQETKLYQS